MFWETSSCYVISYWPSSSPPFSPLFQIRAVEYLLVVDHWSHKLKTSFGAMLVDKLFYYVFLGQWIWHLWNSFRLYLETLLLKFLFYGFYRKEFDGLMFICGRLITLCFIILLLIIYKTGRASKSLVWVWGITPIRWILLFWIRMVENKVKNNFIMTKYFFPLLK